MHSALIHDRRDDVAVVIADIAGGSEVVVVTTDAERVASIEVREDIPLGHKIAVREIAQGRDVIKYGRSIGYSTVDIPVGSHVHTHNIASRAWK